MAANIDEILDNKRGHVKNVCKEFLLKNDETLAHKLQDQEYYVHYDQNRKQRRSIRSDLPVAKSIHQIEYEELMRRHERLEKLEKDDEQIAREIQKKYSEEINKLQRMQQEADEEYARNLDNNVNNEVVSVSSSRTSRKIKNDLVDNMIRLNLNNKNKDIEIQTLVADDCIFTKMQEEEDYEIAKYLQEQEEKLAKAKIQDFVQSKNDIIRTSRTDNQPNGIYNSNGKSSNNNTNNRIIYGPFIIESNSEIDSILPDSNNNGSNDYYNEIPYQSLPNSKTSSKKKSKLSRIFS